MFDHQRSDRVDVFANAAGEFVQVWDSTRGTTNRRLLLTYLRTPTGPREISHSIYLDDGPFELVVATDLRRVYHYRDGGGSRQERFLSSGRLLINDPRHGLKMRSVFTADFDWEKQVPKGKPLGDKQAMRLQVDGALWYVSIYQESTSEPEARWLVEEHRGFELVRSVEIGRT